MKIAIEYATVEGQTGKIARFVEKVLSDEGHDTEMIDVENDVDGITTDGCDAVILAAPVHQRRHPRTFEAALEADAEALESLPTLMLSVSLSAAFPEGREEAQDYLDEMKMRCGFRPTKEALVAGAIRLGRYDYFAAQVVKLVVLRDRSYDPVKGDNEFTDWDALKATVLEFVKEAA